MPESRSNERFTGQLKRASVLFAMSTIGIVVLAGLGWVTGAEALASIVPGWPTMKPVTASCFLVSAAILCLFRHSIIRESGLRIGGTLLLLIGALAMSNAFAGWTENLGRTDSILQLLVQSMSAASALLVCLFGASYMALAFHATRLAQYLGLGIVFFGLFCVVGLLYGLDFISGVFFSTMSLNTSLAAIFLGLAVLFLRADEGIMRIFVMDVAGAVLRRTLPFIIGLPILIGWVRLKGQEFGIYGTTVGTALFVVIVILTFTVVVAHLARHLQRAETGRRRAVSVIERKDEELRGEHRRLLEARGRLADQNRRLEELVSQRTQQLEGTVRSLETVVYTIAHDLRAPLRAMQGFARALQDDYGPALDETAGEYCDRIAVASHRMDALLADLLQYARLSHLDLPSTRVDLNAEIEGVLGDLKEQIASVKACVTVGKPLPKVCAEQAILDQVLFNLVTNALKFMRPDVTPTVHIRAESRDAYVRLWVEDNGIGIAPEHQQRIFQVFQRLHTTTEYPGTGIGLAIVQKAVEQMGGHVGVDSEVGKGSRFWIELLRDGKCAA